MDAVRTDQDVTAHAMDMRTAAIEEISGHPAFVLRKRAKPAAGVDGLRPQPFDHGLMDHALQTAAMNGELRHLVAGIEPARLVPDLLAVAGQVEQLIGLDADLIEAIKQTQLRKFPDCMRQSVDADAKLADRVRLFIDLAINAAGSQHERGGQAADPATDNNRLHRPYSTRCQTPASLARPVIPPQAALSPPLSAPPGSSA